MRFDLYLDKDWSILDEVQAAVLSLLTNDVWLPPVNESLLSILRLINLPRLKSQLIISWSARSI
jgi:hypothetical protein